MPYLLINNTPGLDAYMNALACEAKLQADEKWRNLDEKSKEIYNLVQLVRLNDIGVCRHVSLDPMEPGVDGKEIFTKELVTNAYMEAVRQWKMLNETTKNYFARIESEHERFRCKYVDCNLEFRYDCELHVHLHLDHRVYGDDNKQQERPQPQSQAVNMPNVDPLISSTLKKFTELALDN